MFESRSTLKKLLEASERTRIEFQKALAIANSEHKMALLELEQLVKMKEQKLEFEYKTKELAMDRANVWWRDERHLEWFNERMKTISASNEQTQLILEQVLSRLPDITASLTVGKPKGKK